MTYNKFIELANYAKTVGITTIGELAAFKARYGIQTNDELLEALKFKTLLG